MSIAQRMDDLNLTVPRWAFVPLRDFYIAFGIVATLSSALAVAQALGWHPIHQWLPNQSPGLFFNPIHAGAVMALTIVAMQANRLQWLIPGLLPGLCLSYSRGAIAATAFGLFAHHFRKPLWLLVLVLGLGFLHTLSPTSSDMERLHIWRAAWVNLTFWGNGFDSFAYLFMVDQTGRIIHPEYAHNDFLQVVFEYGVWSVVPFSVIAWAVSRTSARDWPTLATFLFMACFMMPMHMPIPLALGALALATTLGESNA